MKKNEVYEITNGMMTFKCFKKKYLCNMCGEYIYSEYCNHDCDSDIRDIQIADIAIKMLGENKSNLLTRNKTNFLSGTFTGKVKSELETKLDTLDFDRKNRLKKELPYD